MQKYIQNLRLCLLIFILSGMSTQAQVLQWSNATKLKGGAVFTKVIGENEKGVYLLRYRNRFYNKNIILERYSSQLVFDKSINIELRKARLSKLYLTTKGILVIKTKYIRQQQENRLIAQWYNFDFEEMGESVVLAKTVVKDFGDRGNFRIRMSDDLQSLAVLYSEIAAEDQSTLYYQLFSDSLVRVVNDTFDIAHDYNTLVLQDILLTNDRKVSILANVAPRPTKRVKTTDFHMFTLAGSTLYDTQITDSVDLKSPRLIYNRQHDQATVASFYGPKEQQGIVGALFFSMNSTLDSGAVMWSKFGEDLIDKITKNDRNEDAVSEGFSILEATPRSDGGMLIIAEQKNIATEDDIILVNGLPQSTSKNIYNFNEILLLNYDDSAYLDWHKLITKNQTTVNDGGYFSSVVIYTGPKYIQLLYNDQLRSSGDVMQYTVYNNGMEKSKKLLKAELDYVAIVPSEAMQVSSNKVIIPTSKNRRFALLKLVYH